MSSGTFGLRNTCKKHNMVYAVTISKVIDSRGPSKNDSDLGLENTAKCMGSAEKSKCAQV